MIKYKNVTKALTASLKNNTVWKTIKEIRKECDNKLCSITIRDEEIQEFLRKQEIISPKYEFGLLGSGIVLNPSLVFMEGGGGSTNTWIETKRARSVRLG